jgi:hypothetical protein
MDQGTLVGFLTGVGVTLAGALFASIAQRANARLRRKEEARFEIYMRLLRIDSWYFHVTVAEVHRESCDPEVWRILRSESWQIADKLRESDEVEYLDEILNVLLADNFATACDRAKALDELISKLGKLVNPKYSKAIRNVSHANQRKLFEDASRTSNAPGRTWPFLSDATTVSRKKQES